MPATKVGFTTVMKCCRTRQAILIRRKAQDDDLYLAKVRARFQIARVSQRGKRPSIQSESANSSR